MQPFTLFCLLGLCWVLLHFWVHPLVENEWKAADLRRKMMRSSVLVVVQKLRDLAAIGALVMLGVLALVGIANLLGNASVVWPKALIEAVASLYRVAKGVADGYGAVLGWLGLASAAGVLWWAGRGAKRQVHELWMREAQSQHSQNLAESARIEAARGDPDFAPIVEAIDRALATIHAQDGASQPDAEAKERAKALLNNALAALAIEQARKNVDFLAATAPSEVTAEPRSAWGRILRAVMSKRFAEDAGLLKKPVGWVLTALLFVSLTGWTAEAAADSLRLAVNNLRVQLMQAEAERDLDRALSAAPPAPNAADPLPPASQPAQTAARLLTNAITRELIRAPLLDRTAGIRRSAESEAEFVRAALTHRELPASQGDVADRLRAESALQNQAGTGHGEAMQRHVRSHAEAVAAQLHAREPRRFADLVSRLEARYSHPVTPSDAQGRLMGRILDEAFGMLDAKPEGELSRQSQKLTKDFGKEAVKTWANARMKQFLADAIAGASRPDVHRDFSFEASKTTRELIESLRMREGQGWGAAAIAKRESEMAAKVADAVARELAKTTPEAPPSALEPIRERLGGYDRLFPVEEALPLIAEHGPSKSQGGSGGGEARSATSHKAAGQARANSFQAASRSFRVRGVLVGQNPEGPLLDMTELRWRVIEATAPGLPTRVVVEARVVQGNVDKWRLLGDYEAGVLNQALRYAGDRRVVATTITEGDGRVTGRLTYLHPVLTDTPLGCRVIEADRFIDTFASDRLHSGMPGPVSELVDDRAQMQMWLRAAALAERVGALRERRAACPAQEVQKAARQMRIQQVRFSPPMTSAVDGFLSGRGSGDTDRTRLLQQATGCARGSPDSLGQCLCEAPGSTGLASHYWFPEDHTSQVRERSVRIDAGLDWLRPSADRLGHFDLWVHTTFSLRNSATHTGDESQTLALDFPPAQLSGLRQWVGARLPGYLHSHLRSPSYDAFMAPLEEFVLAQRWARSALQGQLGRDFPLQQLLVLERETRRFVPRQVTIRWEPAGSPAYLMQTLTQADPAAADAYKAHLTDFSSRRKEGRPVCDPASK